MIEFPCRCGYQLSVPQELAGGVIQCPQCKLLADVPGLGDLPNLETDGTLKLDAPPAPDDPEQIEKLREAFLPRKTDDNGEEFDLRPTMEDILKAGADEIPLELEGEVRPGAPKYDPETGELIQPLGVKQEQPKPVVPIPQGSATLAYSTDHSNEWIRPHLVPLALFKPGNIVVMLMVFLAHFLAQITVVATAAGLFFAAAAVLVAYMLVLAHYGNVVEETGPFERDELPSPGRGLSWGEDIWHPFIALSGALMLCYLPALAAVSHCMPAVAKGHYTGLLVGGGLLWLLGSFFFPVVFLTLSTGATVRNLRPDRLLGVIAQCGRAYFMIVPLWIVTSAVYGVALLAATHFAVALAGTGPRVVANVPTALGYPVIFAGVYLMHLFCWYLGLVYRGNHEKFPWILQRHIPTRKVERRIPPRRKRRVPAAATADASQQSQTPPAQQAVPVRPMPVEPVDEKPISLISDADQPLPPRR